MNWNRGTTLAGMLVDVIERYRTCVASHSPPPQGHPETDRRTIPGQEMHPFIPAVASTKRFSGRVDWSRIAAPLR